MSNSNTSIRPLRKLQWLIRRELWEHKGMLLWAPVLIGILMTVLGALFAAATIAKTKARTLLTINGEDISLSSLLNAKAFVQRKADIIEVVTNNYTYTA